MPTSDAPRLLRVLHIEDSELDHELMVTQMRRAGLTVHTRRVETAAQFDAALAEGDGDPPWDIVLSDYSLPGFSGLVALEMLKARGGLTPFIIVSGEIGEDTAVEAMRNGAADYLLKNNLARLVPAMLHDDLEAPHATLGGCAIQRFDAAQVDDLLEQIDQVVSHRRVGQWSNQEL